MSKTTFKSKFSSMVVEGDNCEIALLVGEEVFELLSDEGFQVEWDALYGSCPWATVFQSRAFVATWYRIYQAEYLPILVKGEQQGRLAGLLTMALPLSCLKGADLSRAKGKIVGAGASQAEYQVWLSSVPDEGCFVERALKLVVIQFSRCEIQLKYVPGKASLEWVGSEEFWKKRCIVRPAKQPLLVIDDVKIDKELRKKNRREKINRLKRLGNLRFERITDTNIFLSIFDEVALQYDFRKEAMFNTNFFQADPLRKDFLIELFSLGILHTTVLKLDNEIIASNLGATDKNWVHLQGINSHSPAHAKYSPGILHFLMLSKQLSEEGIEVFDLTPGADAYKEVLATDYTLASQLNICSTYGKARKAIRLKLVEHIKNSALSLGILKPNELYNIKWKTLFLKNKIKKSWKYSSAVIANISSTGSAAKVFYKIHCPDYTRIGQIETGELFIKSCSLSDFLNFEQTDVLTRWEFLEEAMRRFESGERSYTWSEGGRLLACAWRSASKPATDGDHQLPEGAVLLQGFYCHPAGRGRLKAFLETVAGEVAREPGVEEVYAMASHLTTGLCRSLEELSVASRDN